MTSSSQIWQDPIWQVITAVSGHLPERDGQLLHMRYVGPPSLLNLGAALELSRNPIPKLVKGNLLELQSPTSVKETQDLVERFGSWCQHVPHPSVSWPHSRTHPQSPTSPWDLRKDGTRCTTNKRGYHCGSPPRALKAELTVIRLSHPHVSFLELLGQMDREMPTHRLWYKWSHIQPKGTNY